MTSITDSFGYRLRHLRLQKALSQEDLADVSGVSRTTVLKLENDALGRQPRPSTVRKLARALRVRPIELVGE